MKKQGYLQRKTIGNITVLTIDRPEVLNAINLTLLLELEEFLEEAIASQQSQGIIITGSGSKAFIAGADIKEIQKMNQSEMIKFCERGQRVTTLLEDKSLLSIAAVNGYAFGGGLEIALSCDLIYAANTAKLGLPEITLGLIPGFGGTQRLLQAAGVYKAKEMIFTGNPISASEAKDIGFVNQIFEQDKLIDECVKMAQHILSYSFSAFKSAKKTVEIGYIQNRDAAFALERTLCAFNQNSTESKTAIGNFLKKDFLRS